METEKGPTWIAYPFLDGFDCQRCMFVSVVEADQENNTKKVNLGH